MPGTLPKGWRITSRQLRSNRFASTAQAVFMPAGSTADHGPALVVGFTVDEEYAPSTCARGVRGQRDVVGSIVRWGGSYSQTPVPGPGFYTYNDAYVFGRDVSDEDLRRAASSVQWHYQEMPTVALPPAFRLRATSHLDAQGPAWLARQSLAGPDGQGIDISQEQANTAGVFVADFWSNITKGQACNGYLGQGDQMNAVTTVIRGNTVVRILAPANRRGQEVAATMERALRRVSRRTFCGPARPDPTEPAGTCSSE